MTRRMSQEEMRLFGVTETKIAVLNTLIKASIENKGLITTNSLVAIRDGIIEADKKQEVIDKLK